MTALVTGASGFVGAAVVRALAAQGERVRALVRPTSDRRNLADLPVEIVTGDLTDRGSLGAAMRGCRVVFHVAADYRLWAPDPRPMYAVNVDGSLNVVESAAEHGIERVVYTSSVAVLGINADRTPADETTPVSIADMIGPYKRSKYVAEEVVKRRAAELELPLVVVNPSTPIGPGDVRPTPTGRIIVDAATGRMPAFVDTGLNLVHVDDVARGHLLALERGTVGERYILGGADMTLERILALVAKHCGRKAPWLRLPRAGIYPVAVISEIIARVTDKEPRITLDGLRMAKKHMYFSSRKAERELGYRWRAPEEAIADALDWFRRNGYVR
ncbi:MAG TPA: hopanoid-associated sugar epimerase [Gammaproteobacteria bacterium]